jgi:starch phosphorylase
MAEEIGAENMFIFGLNASEVVELKQRGYDPRHYYESDPELKRVVDSLIDGSFENGEKGVFLPIWKSLVEEGDTYCHLADFRAFVEASAKADNLYKDRNAWVKTAIINIARMGKFSSDRAINEYARDIWKVEPLQMDFN